MFYMLRDTGVSDINLYSWGIYSLAVKTHVPVITMQRDICYNRNMYPEEGEINLTLRNVGKTS